MATKNTIWIELKEPESKEFAELQCKLANNMLARLAKPEHLPLAQTFFFSDYERRYCFGGAMGYKVLTDHGEWFNLDYLGRE